MTNPHIETLVNFLRDFAESNADSFEPEQIENLKQSAHAIVILDKAVDDLVKDRDHFANDLARAESERDDARREICFLTVFDPEVPHADCSIYEREVATKRGWDCFPQEDGK